MGAETVSTALSGCSDIVFCTYLQCEQAYVHCFLSFFWDRALEALSPDTLHVQCSLLRLCTERKALDGIGIKGLMCV